MKESEQRKPTFISFCHGKTNWVASLARLTNLQIKVATRRNYVLDASLTSFPEKDGNRKAGTVDWGAGEKMSVWRTSARHCACSALLAFLHACLAHPQRQTRIALCHARQDKFGVWVLPLKPASKDFSYNQPPGPNNYILLRNGRKKLVRSLQGKHRLTKLDKLLPQKVLRPGKIAWTGRQPRAPRSSCVAGPRACEGWAGSRDAVLPVWLGPLRGLAGGPQQLRFFSCMPLSKLCPAPLLPRPQRLLCIFSPAL